MCCLGNVPFLQGFFPENSPGPAGSIPGIKSNPFVLAAKLAPVCDFPTVNIHELHLTQLPDAVSRIDNDRHPVNGPFKHFESIGGNFFIFGSAA